MQFAKGYSNHGGLKPVYSSLSYTHHEIQEKIALKSGQANSINENQGTKRE